ncbi:MAG: FGGY family carbohydrate kinase [Micropruina sp.]
MTTAVGIDIGTTNTKVVRVANGVSATMLNRPTPVHLDDLLALVMAGLSAATRAGRVDAVGIASMAESGFPLDRDDRPLTPLLSWQDARDDTEIRALADQLGADALFESTGVRPGPKPSLAVWLWLRAQRPEVFTAMHRWAGVADAVHLALTGELRTDHTLAGRTLAYRLPPSGKPLDRRFDPTLLSEAGLTVEQLPDVALPGDRAARTTRGIAQTGLRVGTPVVVAGHDHQVAAWASGVRAVGNVADSVGTAEAVLNLVGRVPDRPAVRTQGMSVVRAIDGVTEALLAGTGSAGGFLQWLADRQMGGDVTGLLTGATGAADVPAHHAPAHDAPAGDLRSGDLLAGDAWLLPYPSGRQCPHADPAALVRRIGAPAHLGVAALESLAYQAQWVLDAQTELSGCHPTQLRLAGRPLHRTPLWARIKATLSRVPTTLTTATEPVSTGAALLALHRAGITDEPPLAACQIAPFADDLRDRYLDRLAAFIASAR